jgi:hypothetical protein
MLGNPLGALPPTKLVETGHGSEVKMGFKKDFFGRILEERVPTHSQEQIARKLTTEAKVWCSFHEGFSNAVRKPLTLAELMASFEY